MSEKSSRIAGMKLIWPALLPVVCLAACQSLAVFAPLPTLAALPSQEPRPAPSASPTAAQANTAVSTNTATPAQVPSETPAGSASATFGPTTLPAGLNLDPADWENWPVLPIIPARARQIYLAGQALGNNAHAFSVFGDCQAEPQVFMGVFESDPQLVAKLPENLRTTVAWFAGSFNRESPTVLGGTTSGALLWPAWHQNKYTCTVYESPIQCELRIHKPAFVIIQVGTHYESHNDVYMRKILDDLMAAGVVPILATKADNRELDHHVNAEYAQLAVEYSLPFWNFWAATGELPNRGLYTKPGLENQGDVYLTDVAANIHRLSALLVLDQVRQAVIGP
jgi:hypothetical protein